MANDCFWQIKGVFERIRKAIADKPFYENVVRPFYAVENKYGAADKGVRLTELFEINLEDYISYWMILLCSTASVYFMKIYVV